LEARGVRVPNGGTRWHAAAVHAIEARAARALQAAEPMRMAA
jgi:hypothetical protein